MSRFREHVANQALDALVALYEPGAVFVPKPGVVHTGRPEIGGALAEMLGLSPVMETNIREVHQADDVALVIVDWSLRGTAPDVPQLLNPVRAWTSCGDRGTGPGAC